MPKIINWERLFVEADAALERDSLYDREREALQSILERGRQNLGYRRAGMKSVVILSTNAKKYMQHLTSKAMRNPTIERIHDEDGNQIMFPHLRPATVPDALDGVLAQLQEMTMHPDRDVRNQAYEIGFTVLQDGIFDAWFEYQMKAYNCDDIEDLATLWDMTASALEKRLKARRMTKGLYKRTIMSVPGIWVLRRAGNWRMAEFGWSAQRHITLEWNNTLVSYWSTSRTIDKDVCYVIKKVSRMRAPETERRIYNGRSYPNTLIINKPVLKTVPFTLGAKLRTQALEAK